MNCETARGLLLEADLHELRGEGGRDLARHVRECSACQAVARRILDQTAALGARLERLTPPTTAASGLKHPATRTSARRWAVAVPLALAASLAVVLLSRDRPAPTQVTGVSSPIALGPTPLDVQVPGSQAVTVFQTDNPNIVVIWSF